jgi:uncharacterized membrane protein YbhN (UPF0104 family)
MVRRSILLALSAAAALLGAYLFYRVLQRYEFRDVLDSLQSASLPHIALMLAMTACSFACISAMEVLAVRYAEGGTKKAEPKISLARIWRTAVAALGVGHSLGLSALSSGAIRYRMYSRRRLGLTAIGEIVVFSGISVALGLGAVGGLALMWHGETLARILGFSTNGIYAIGAVGLTLCSAYIGTCAFAPPPLRIFRYRLRLPNWRVAVAQLLISGLNYACIAAVLYGALASFAEAPYPQVAALLVGSEASAILAHVPGSWGLLEYVFATAFSGPGVVTGLLLFRAIYYLLPLFVGFAVWLADEVAARREPRGNSHDLKTQNA